jgi:hypothetical protein
VGVGKAGWILRCKFGTVSCEGLKLHHVRPQKAGKKNFQRKRKEFGIHTVRLLDQQKYFIFGGKILGKSLFRGYECGVLGLGL